MAAITQYKLTPALSASPAYTAGDVLFDTTSIQAGLMTGFVKGVSIIDKDDVGEGCDLYFLSSNVTLGTANAVPSISDTNAENIIGIISGVTATKDLGGCRFNSIEFTFGFEIQPGGSLYVAAITNTAFTHTASGLVFIFRFQSL